MRRWSVFDGFSRPQPAAGRSWSDVAAWTELVEAQLRPRREEVARRRDSWMSALATLGGDPTARDWASFRALRREREEDWSDWLAQLVEDSNSGRLSWLLFSRAGTETNIASFALPPQVRREVPCRGARADILIDWASGARTHIEVKVGDPNLAKTCPTASGLEEQFGGRWSHFILVLPEQREAWAAEYARFPEPRPVIHDLTWLDVARALRVCIRAAEESLAWCIWAHAFSGVIEQELLGLRYQDALNSWGHRLTPAELLVAEVLFREGTDDNAGR